MIRYDEYTCNYSANINLQQNRQCQKYERNVGSQFFSKNDRHEVKCSKRKVYDVQQVYKFYIWLFALALLESMKNYPRDHKAFKEGLFCSLKSNYANIVSASDYSNTALKFSKIKTNTIQTNDVQKNGREAQNVQNLKNLKREFQSDKETIGYTNQIKKKANCLNYGRQTYLRENQLNLSSFLKTLKEQDDFYFSPSTQKGFPQKNDHYNTNKSIIFPDPTLPNIQHSENELLTRTIDIMSNKNEKIAIPIHEGLYKSNTSHKNQFLQDNSADIPNICDFRMKNQYSESIQFIRQYKSGYIPIEMQKRNNEDIQEQKKDQTQSPTKGGSKDKSRSHFIRKQQSTLTLPRTVGVSYIKPSESLITQKLPFEPLPPLIFQGSTSCFIGSNQEAVLTLDSNIKQLINKFSISLENSWLPFVTSNQDEMRDILLGKRTKNAKVGFVHGIENLWPLFVESSFILIIISPQKLLTEKEIWQALEKRLNFFKIGILAKKSTSGKKAFLKSIKNDTSSNLSVASFETSHNQIKVQNSTESNQMKRPIPCHQNRKLIDLKDSSEEEKKISTTFQLLEEQLKDNRTVLTMSLRLQMYVQEMDWKQRYTRENKELLNQLIMNLKDRLEKKSIRIICERLQLSKEGKINPFDKNYQFIRICKSGNERQLDHQHIISQKINQKSFEIVDFLEKQVGNLQLSQQNKEFLLANTSSISPSYFLNGICSQDLWKKSLKFPLYYISTRDSFAFDLIQRETILKRSNGRQYTKIEYYFYPDNTPTNFGYEYRTLFPKLDVGATSYHGFFTEEQLKEFQQNTFSMQKKAFKNKFLQMTVQPSIVSTKIKRTKFFFGYRYMWTRCQLSEPCSYVGAGVRKDVALPPQWTNKISDEMVKENIVEKDFINSIAVNVYHDGKQGLAQHFDDAVRFKQPIYTLRLFSDARLSFGSQFYGFCNGAFIIPLPRGCILVMQQNSYAANGVKHCVRPCDMTGKSAAVILRQMHSQVVSQASKYDEYIDFPAWLSCLSENENSITYAEQKRLEAEQIMKVKDD